MTRTRLIGLAMILASTGISMLWGFSIARNANGWVDFRAVYFGTRCLLQNHDPYKLSDLESVYTAERGAPSYETKPAHQAVTLYVNVPTTFLFVAPFAMLPWGPAHVLWLTLITLAFLLAAILMWDLGAAYSPKLSLLLICIFLANCESIFVAGNTAGLVVSLCVLAVWCFVKQRFVLVGVVCMAVSLAMKPHDGGLVWLYFLLAGPPYRKRALQSFALTAIFGIVALIWVFHVAPDWIEHWRANMAAISLPGGINEPGPNAVTGRSPSMVIDLQAAISIFKDDPRVYNPISYLVCGAPLLLWSVRTFMSRALQSRLWYGLAAVIPLTMLITYHRPWDAKMLVLTIPACCMLWAGRGRVGWIALLVNTAAIVLTADIPLAISVIFADLLHARADSVMGKILMVIFNRPASLVLLALAIFYLWVYLRGPPPMGTTAETRDTEKTSATTTPA